VKLKLLIVLALIGKWAKIVQRRVATSAIIECFDTKEKIVSGLVAGLISAVMHELASQLSIEAFHLSVVIPASDAAHTDLDAEQCF
jgi:hypothetical protein